MGTEGISGILGISITECAPGSEGRSKPKYSTVLYTVDGNRMLGNNYTDSVDDE
jgi:hypothetical protein